MQISLTSSQDQIYKFLCKEIEKTGKLNQGFNHTLIIGESGSGKTTLLKQLFNKVETDKAIKKHFSSGYLSLLYSADNIDKLIENLIVQANISISNQQYIVFIDDIDNLLGQSEEQAHLLRKLLLRKNPKISIVATAGSLYKESLSHSSAFFGFFRVMEINRMSDGDIELVMSDIQNQQFWTKLNNSLGLINPFWFITITDLNLRLTNILKTVALSHKKNIIEPSVLLENYFDLAGPIFQRQLQDVSKLGRVIVEQASTQGKEFQMADLKITNISNLPSEASRLVKKDIFLKIGRGKYKFKSNGLKAWLRFVKNTPIGRTISPDIELEQHIQSNRLS